MAEQQDLDQKNQISLLVTWNPVTSVKLPGFVACFLFSLIPSAAVSLGLGAVAWAVCGPREAWCSPAPRGCCTGSALVGPCHGSTLRHSATSFAEKAGWQEKEPNHRLNRLGVVEHVMACKVTRLILGNCSLYHDTWHSSTANLLCFTRFPCSRLCLSKHGTDIFLSQAQGWGEGGGNGKNLH